jgi:DNA-binding winged helix-turn-helix (wHTH) protein/Tfp pilus assembly protein PilF
VTAGVARYRFGPFTLDVAAYRLLRDDVDVAVSPRLIDLLRYLVERPSALASKEELFAAIWPDVIVSDNALTQAISDLRQALGDSASRPVYVQTVARRGYRFIAAVTPVTLAAPATHAGPDSVGPAGLVDGGGSAGSTAGSVAGSGGFGIGTSPFSLRAGRRARESSSLEATRAFLEGRWRLEALDADLVPDAIAHFQTAVEHDPSFAAAYVGLANALFWAYEASRDLNTPDTALLRRAVDAARQAMALDPELPDAHATLAFILVAANRIEEARAAGRRAVALDPTYWAHHFRLGHAAWGDERLRAHAEALALYPDFAFAHFQIAMVHIARNELPLAEQTLRQGIVVRERHQQSSERFPARGLHWLLGLVLLAREDDVQAARQFERELASAGGRLYAREFSIAAHNGLGLIALKKGDAVDAADRFRQALARYEGHARSHFGLAAALALLGEKAAAESELAAGRAAADALEKAGRTAESVVASAMGDVLHGLADDACRRLAVLVESAPPGFAGWTIPIEPAFASLHGREEFREVLRVLAERAK